MCQLLLKKWNVLREIIYLLQIPFNATIAFQNQKLTLSDVYGRWLGMQLHFEACLKKSSFKTRLAEHLLKALKTRNAVIFNNPLMSCALYLDPRFQRQLLHYPEKIDEAKDNMMKIWRRLIVLKHVNTGLQTQTQADAPANVSSESIDFLFDEADAVARHVHGENQLSTQNKDTTNHSTTRLDHDIDIERIIDMFQAEVEPMNISIIEYWENIKEQEPELYQIAMVVFSVPPTEVQIERDFSALDFIFTKRRGNLSEDRLDDIFLIHLNKDLFYEVNRDELNALVRNQCASK